MKKLKSWPRISRLLLGLCLASLLSVPTFTYAKNSFLVAPGRVDFDLGRPNTQSFIITNNGDGDIRLKIEPVYFAIDDKALAAGKPINPAKKIDDDLRPYMRVSPRVLSLKPGQRRDIRLSVRPKGNMPEGDYRAHVLVKMLETAQVFSTDDQDRNEESVGMKVEIKFETAAAVYGHRGKRQPKLDLQCVKNEENTLVVNVKNASKWRFEGEMKVLLQGAANNSEALYTKALNSTRESLSTVVTNWQIPTNKKIKLYWKDNWEGNFTGEVDCSFE